VTKYKGTFMHGVGLLRVSRTPVTVDSEEYVVFIRGWLSPDTFGSWREAMTYFEERMKFVSPKQGRIRSRVGRPKGVKPGSMAYRKALEQVG
jgi:hypothetical protein